MRISAKNFQTPIIGGPKKLLTTLLRRMKTKPSKNSTEKTTGIIEV